MKTFAIGLILLFLMSCTEFEAGGTACGKGRLESQILGLGGRTNRLQVNEINNSLPCKIYLPGSGSFASSFGLVLSTRTLYGEGNISVYVKKNGVICNQQTKSGKGILKVRAECR